MLSGCTAPAPPDPTPTATASAITYPEPGTVVATGTLESPDATVSGEVSIRMIERSAGVFELALSNFSSSVESVEAALVPEPIDASVACYDEGFRVGTPRLTAEPEQAHMLGDLGTITFGADGDPTFFDAVVIVRPPASDEERATCLQWVVGFANLEWSLAPRYPDLELTDRGPIDGATGEVTEERGVPAAYLVAEGDVYEVVADRFGLTLDELMYLNPTRTGNGQDPMIVYTDETLNLDPTQR